MPQGEARTVLVIIGMRDNSCRERVSEALGRIDGVKDVDVSLIRSRATIAHGAPCRLAELVWAVVSEGYGVALGNAERRDGREQYPTEKRHADHQGRTQGP